VVAYFKVLPWQSTEETKGKQDDRKSSVATDIHTEISPDCEAALFNTTL
jgi:hypothetical protein